ncbi:MAG: murein biosynthesis integral membrane protein MurJ [Planctomycetes bacterium]|nr:murein biosynthesis integral membrane protein MurJ [Planctomycetota bacterium]
MTDLGSGAGADAPVERIATHGEAVIRRQHGVGRRTVWISLLTLVSRVLGMAREVLAAGLFGHDNPIYDAFLFAWRIPNLFRRFLGEGALSTSLQATLTEADAHDGDAAGREVFLATLRLVTLVLVTLCALCMTGVALLPESLMPYLGVAPEAARELVLRLLPFVVIVCLTAAAGGALNVRGHYTLPALGPVLLNVVWIAALVAIAWLVTGETDALQLERARWLSWGVLLSSLVQFVVLFPALRTTGLWHWREALSRPSARARRAAREVFRRSAPLAFGAAVYQINVMIDGLMAQRLLEPGGQTAHYLANRVQQFPLALVAIAATTAVFPALAALGQARRLGELRALHDLTQRSVLFVALPAAVGLAVLAQPIAEVLFRHGAFEEEGARRIAAALRVLAAAVLSAGAVGLVVRTYYALGDFGTPVRVSCAMLLTNVGLNLLFLRGFGMDVDGLALATTLSSVGNFALLFPGLTRRLGLPPAAPGFAGTLARTALAATACGGVAWAVERYGAAVLPGWLALCLAMGTGAGAYALAAETLAIPEWVPFRARLGRLSRRLRPF